MSNGTSNDSSSDILTDMRAWRMGDGGRVELEDAETGGIVGCQKGVVLGSHLWGFLSSFPFPRSFVGLPAGLPVTAFARLSVPATCGVAGGGGW